MPLRDKPINPYEGVPRDAANWPFRAAVGLEVVLERQGDEQGARRARRLAHELANMKEPARFDLNLGSEFEFYGHVSGAKSAYERAISANYRQ